MQTENLQPEKVYLYWEKTEHKSTVKKQVFFLEIQIICEDIDNFVLTCLQQR